VPGLERIGTAAKASELCSALRVADHAWRTREESPELASLYGWLLAMAGEHRAALRLFLLAAESKSDPGVEIGAVSMLLSLENEWTAINRLESALMRLAVEPGGDLSHAARSLLGGCGGYIPGWIGVSPQLALTGQVMASVAPVTIEGRSPTNELIWRRVVNPGPRCGFTIDVPKTGHPMRLFAHAGDAPLLGGGIAYPPAFGLDGRAAIAGNLLVGWARLAWWPKKRLSLLVASENGGRHRPVMAGPDGAGHKFDMPWPKADISCGRITVSARLPDGQMAVLPDAPLLTDAFVRKVRRRQRQDGPGLGPGRAHSARRSVDIVIPVYLGYDETTACIESVMDSMPSYARIVVIDDASPDRALSAYLDRLARSRKIVLLRNETNRGFVGSVNRAIEWDRTRDILLLNADTMVFGDWLIRLRRVAYSGWDIGSVTPLTHDGSIVSFPSSHAVPLSADAARMVDVFVSKANRGTRIGLPVGVGFCLYLRRDCLDDTGSFDQALFGHGYGEEADFCLRAAARGWRHILAANVFVYHAGGRSFGGRRAALLERSDRLLRLLHPHFGALVETFSGDDPLRVVRRAWSEKRLLESGSSYALIVTLAREGGVDRFVKERCRDLRSAGIKALLLKPDGVVASSRCVIVTEDESISDLAYDIPRELPTLHRLVHRLSFVRIELHHVLGHHPNVIELVRSLGRPYDAFIHDYVWLCPRVTLIGSNGRYCGEPAVRQCRICVAKNGSELSEPIDAAELRRRSARWLGGADRVIAPSQDAAARIRRHFPGLAPMVMPWEHIVHGTHTVPRRDGSDRLRVAVIGAIGQHKGYGILLACARAAAKRNLPLEFIVIGYTENDDILLKTGHVFVTGPYIDDEAPNLIRREDPHLAFFPSVWPETWCYALGHALRAGLDVVAFDLGAIAERLRAVGIGTIVPLQTPAAELNRLMMAAALARTDMRRNEPASDRPRFRRGVELGASTHDACGGAYEHGV
jgi:GT2 family glycosyltransferase